jgi:hypothetical protein
VNPQTRPKNGASKGANRLALISLIVAPSHESAEPKLLSLMHHILLCDLHTVRSILGQMESTSEEYQRNSILEDRIEGNRSNNNK